MISDVDLEDEIRYLLSEGYEGGYWDFKAQWADGAELLHDILCMANNLEDRDAYIITGIDEANGYSISGVEHDTRRRNTNQLTTFLRYKRFLGGVRPTALVKTIYIDAHDVDVLIIKNSTTTPYMVVTDFADPPVGKRQPRTVKANSVYTRVQDTNTPINETADLDKTEYLWRKRFGIHKTALDRFAALLDTPEDWEYNDTRARFFHKYAPEFVIQIGDSYSQEDRETRAANKRSEFYCKLFPDSDGYHWEDFEVKYHQTVIIESTCAYLDGGRHLVAIPEREFITRPDDHVGAVLDERYFILYYYDRTSLTGKINRLFVYHYSQRHDAEHNPLGRSVALFVSDGEKAAFADYLSDHLSEFDGIQTFAELEAAHGRRRSDGWPDTVEEWEKSTMRQVNDILAHWRTSALDDAPLSLE